MKNITYIIPHYNNFERIKILIDSIDLVNDDEIIVVDDFSTDGSYELLSKQINNIKVLRNSKNCGAGKARNKGLESAKNDWIIFADADDYFTRGYREHIEPYLHTSLDVVYFRPTSEVLSVNKSVVGNRHTAYSYLIDSYLKTPTTANLNNLKYKMVVPWSKLIRKDFLINNEIVFDEITVSNDVMFSTRVGYYAEKVSASKSTIYCCTESNTSMTADISYEKTLLRMSIFANQYRYLMEKLPKKELNQMGITGFGVLVLSIKNRYRFSESISLIKILKKNEIPLFTANYFFIRIKRFLKRLVL